MHFELLEARECSPTPHRCMSKYLLRYNSCSWRLSRRARCLPGASFRFHFVSKPLFSHTYLASKVACIYHYDTPSVRRYSNFVLQYIGSLISNMTITGNKVLTCKLLLVFTCWLHASLLQAQDETDALATLLVLFLLHSWLWFIPLLISYVAPERNSVHSVALL